MAPSSTMQVADEEPIAPTPDDGAPSAAASIVDNKKQQEAKKATTTASQHPVVRASPVRSLLPDAESLFLKQSSELESLDLQDFVERNKASLSFPEKVRIL